MARFLRLIQEEGLAGDEILVITFTKKAAAEMKERIVRSLTEAGLRGEAQRAETGPIQTVHSFCERLLRENSLSAGIDPDFVVSSGREDQALMRESFRKAMVAELEEGGPSASLISQMGLASRPGAPQEGAMSLLEAVTQLIEHSHNRLMKPHDLRELGESPDQLVRVILEKGFRDAGSILGRGPLDVEIQRLKDEVRTKRGRTPEWLRKWDEKALREEGRDSASLCLLAARTWELAEEGKREAQTFGFSDLESLALDLVRSSPGVRERCQRSLKAALVDESQDLNPVQHSLLEALALPQVMLVGDPQQSIYGFRHADRELFQEKSREWPTLPLSRNFRSRPGILRFVDRIFLRRWQGEHQPMAPQEVEEGFGAQLPDGDMSGVEIWDPPTGVRKEDWIADQVVQMKEEGLWMGDLAILGHTQFDLTWISDALSRRGIPHQIKGETKRYYARMEVRDVANALSAIANPSDEHAWQAFLLSPFAELSLDAVTLLSAGGMDPDRLPGFVSPHPGDVAKLDRLLVWLPNARAQADRWSAWELLSELLARSPYLVNLARRPFGREMIANVRQLLTIATRSPEKGPLDFADEIRETQRFEHRAEEAAAYDREDGLVTLMTLHSSKGLEFPAVIVDTVRPRLKTGGLAAARTCSAPAFSATDRKGPAWLLLKEEVQTFENQELERVLYVAYTRAKERLCIVAGLKHPHLGLLQEAMKLKPPLPGLVVKSPKGEEA